MAESSRVPHPDQVARRACTRLAQATRSGLAFALLSGPFACSEDLGPAMGDDTTTTTDTPTDDETVDDTGTDDGPMVPEPEGALEYLTPVEHLVRVSMALRGTRPSLAEVELVEQDPAALETVIDEYLEAPQLGEVIRDLHNDALLVQVEVPMPRVMPLQGWFEMSIGDSMMQTSLRLAEHVVVENRPYTELVTADYWVVDELAATVYGTSYDPGGPAWQEVPYPDDRPPAGVLADNSLYLRHQSAGANYNRGRANAISRALLCQNFLTQDIIVDGGLDLSDPETVSNAVTEIEACVGCHQSLDPLASHFFTLPAEPDVQEYFDVLEMMGQEPSYPLPSMYDASQADAWETTNERAPAYFGQPTQTITDLGQHIADDPRFSLCTAKRFYAYFNQTRVEDVPLEQAALLQTVLVDSGFDAKALIREVMLSDDFRVAQGLDDETAQDVHGYRRARPYQMALLFEDLTGFRWEVDVSLIDESIDYGVVSLPRNSQFGFEVLGGGLDSFFVTEASGTVNATTSLFLQSLASQAASFVVEQDMAAAPGEHRLLSAPEDTEEAVVREQLASVVLRLYTERAEPDSPSIDEIYEVFAASLQRSGDPEHAWKTTLTALLQDISIIYY